MSQNFVYSVHLPLQTHSGRKLTWQTNMGTVDLRATFGNGRKHELNVSTYQVVHCSPPL